MQAKSALDVVKGMGAKAGGMSAKKKDDGWAPFPPPRVQAHLSTPYVPPCASPRWNDGGGREGERWREAEEESGTRDFPRIMHAAQAPAVQRLLSPPRASSLPSHSCVL